MQLDDDQLTANGSLTRLGIIALRPTWLKPKEVARYACTKEIRVYRAMRSGNLPAQKTDGGRGYRVSLEDVEQWIKANLPQAEVTAVG